VEVEQSVGTGFVFHDAGSDSGEARDSSGAWLFKMPTRSVLGCDVVFKVGSNERHLGLSEGIVPGEDSMGGKIYL
jgi:hypothetical protein